MVSAATLGGCEDTYATGFFGFEVGVELFIAGGEDGVEAPVHTHADVPFASPPLRVGGVHVPHQLGIIRDEEIGTESNGRS